MSGDKRASVRRARSGASKEVRTDPASGPGEGVRNEGNDDGWSKAHKKSERGGPPAHRNIHFGRPISYDCRPDLERYHREGQTHRPPSVQSLVRGHYKKQVFGQGGQERKVIWIEPYWRGPEEAPILARSRLIDAEHTEG